MLDVDLMKIKPLTKVKLARVKALIARFRKNERALAALMLFEFGTHDIDRKSFYFGALIAMGANPTDALATAIDMSESPVTAEVVKGRACFVANPAVPWRRKEQEVFLAREAKAARRKKKA